MSDALQQARSIYTAFAAGDIPGVLGVLSPSIDWIEMHGGPYGGDFVGPEAVLNNVFMKIGTEWDDFAARPDRFFVEDENVVVLGEYSGTCKATGKSFRAPFAHHWTFGGGQAVRFEQYTDTAAQQDAMRP